MLGPLLLKQGLITAELLSECLREQLSTGEALNSILIKTGRVPEEIILQLLAGQLKLSRFDFAGVTLEASVVAKVPVKIASHYPAMPLVVHEDGSLELAMSCATDLDQIDELRVLLERPIRVVLAPERQILDAIKTHYGIGADTLDHLANAPLSKPVSNESSRPTDLDASQDASIMKFVNQMLLEAYQNRATDIHLEPYQDDLQIRYRIDGVLYEAKIADSLKRHQAAIISRIKIMADLSIAERRLPQDGRIVVRVEGREMDLRVSTLPTPFGESVGIRLLTSRHFLDLPHLGFSQHDLEQLEIFLKKPHGILFLTGPTGSGKTTTLYAFLKQINAMDRKIITLEDPIEYQMKGITQVQVHPKIGLSFGAGLRAMLRHDPDVMMVGEVRDLETAEIAIRVALTGHLIFSTLHTNDAASAVTRLEDIGVQPYLISSSVLCVIAQRLVRLLCPDCRRPEPLGLKRVREFGLAEELAQTTVFQPGGCVLCKETGFQGRTVIYEILPISRIIQDLIVSGAAANVIREQAVREGMRTLRQSGWDKIATGLTSPEEVLRVTLQENLP